MNKWLGINVLLKFTWFVGLVILVYFTYELQINVRQQVESTYKFIPLLWTQLGITFVLGCYIAILFVESWKVQVNLSLLVLVCIPCMCIAIFYPAIITFADMGYFPEFLNNSAIPMYTYKLYSMNIFEIVAGLTLLTSLFSKKS